MEPPNLCFVMERCESSLYDLLHNQRVEYTSYARIQIAADTATAMEYLHSHDPAIIHRDLKSLNLLMSTDGVIKLCDFGLVQAKTTQAGTPAYMAPELLRNRAYNKSVDVYSFGILLFEIFSGEIPFRAYDVEGINRAVCNGERPRIPTLDTPIEIRELMEDCWDQNATRRPSFSIITQRLATLLERRPQQTNLATMEMTSGGDALDDLLGGL